MTREELARLGLCVKELEWGDPQPPNDDCPYDHVYGFGERHRYRIEWKSWKDNPGYTVEVVTGDGWSADFVTSEDTLEAAKAAAQADLDARTLSALEVIATQIKTETE